MYLCTINCPSKITILFRLVLFLFLELLVLASAEQQTAWINEIHYDNTGGDVNEFVEIAYNKNKDTSSSSLLGWKVVFYNGSSGLQYGRVVLDGSIIGSESGGSSSAVQFVKVPKSGIQNSKEGIALIDSDDNLVQFLSYEGTVVAADGPAAGTVSTDIGVSESSSTGAGQSLQLTGIGCSYGDFTWKANLAATDGTANTDQTIISCITETPDNTTTTTTTTTHTVTRHYSAFSLELVCNSTANAGYATRFTYQLVGPDIGDEKRKSSFYYDNLLPALPQSCQQKSRSSYRHPDCGTSGRNKNPYCYDRGHLVMGNHLDNDAQSMYESNIMTNILPQATGFNQAGGAWRKIEDIIECSRDVPNVKKQTIFGGALYTDGANDYFWDSHGIPTPDAFWKIVVREYSHGLSPEVAAYVLPNLYNATDDRLDSDYLKTIAAVRALSGDAMPELPGTYSERDSTWSIPPGCDKS